MSLLPSRLKGALVRFAFESLGQMFRTLRQLWLEITGSLFLCMTVLAAPAAWKEWQHYLQTGSPWRLLIVLLFIVMTAVFGITSFMRARRLR